VLTGGADYPWMIEVAGGSRTPCPMGGTVSWRAKNTPLTAAHAVSLGGTLVTNNVREFSRAPGLEVEDWTREDGAT
jgi:hypothetical protein